MFQGESCCFDIPADEKVCAGLGMCIPSQRATVPIQCIGSDRHCRRTEVGFHKGRHQERWIDAPVFGPIRPKLVRRFQKPAEDVSRYLLERSENGSIFGKLMKGLRHRDRNR